MNQTIAVLGALLASLAAFVPAQSATPAPGPEHRKMSIMFGEWKIETDLRESPLGPAGKWIGEARVRSILGGFGMEWKSEGTGPGGYSEYSELDGYDGKAGKFTWEGYDSGGGFEKATYTIEGDRMVYDGVAAEKGQQYRFRGVTVFSPDRQNAADKREFSTDGTNWKPRSTSRWTKAPALTPAPELKQMDIWTGEWTYEGEAKPSPAGPAGRFSGTVTARWILKGRCLEWRTIEKTPTGVIETLELGGYDPATRTFPFHGFLDNGDSYSGTAAYSGNRVTISVINVINGVSYHSRGVNIFAPDRRSISFTTDISTDGKAWAPWAAITYTRVKSDPKE